MPIASRRTGARPRRVALMTAGALVAAAGLAAAGGPALAAPASRLRVQSAFPTDDLTVRDRTQLTGRRVALPLVDCLHRATECDTTRLLNQLDGFDLDPRLAVTFNAPVDPAVVAAALTVEQVGGGKTALRTGVDRVVYDPQHATVYAHPAVQLASSTTYRLRLRPTRGLPNLDTRFTTLSATTGLRQMRAELDDGTAYAAAGIPAGARGLHVDAVVPAAGTTLSYVADRGSATSTVTSPVPNISGTAAGSYVFGSYLAPSWLTGQRLISQTPTRSSSPTVRGSEQLPFVLILPAGTAPAGGWPVAVFGHGFTRSDADVFLAAAFNASRGLATIATDVVGHGYGPRSTWAVTRGGVTTSVPAHARGIDLDGDGLITSTEGVSTRPTPAPYQAVNNRDGLRQTVADLMTLVRAVGRGADVDSDGTVDLRRTGATYYGQSFGGIYGTMLAAVDPRVSAAALNVAGGPISEIARLSPAFRPLTTASLGGARPGLLNGGTFDGFTESMPLRGDAPVTRPAAGALAIQQFLAEGTWLNRPGSPEAFAPLLRLTPPGGGRAKPVIFQNAYGDQTVPNPTTYTLLAAGQLFDRESLYRNDRTGQAARNPHGFLLDPSFTSGALLAQRQIVEFLLTRSVVDPDGAGEVWEVPIRDPKVLLDLNFPSPLHR